MTNHAAAFEQYLADNTARIEKIVLSYLPTSTNQHLKRYLYDPIKAFSANGGKRFRPLICELACLANGGDASLVYSSAAAIEFFHTAALVHDDIADESTLRRGKACLHLIEGEGLAINVGDLGLSMVNGLVASDKLLSDKLKLRILGELIEMTALTVEGQAMDIGFARDKRYDLTTEDYETMAVRKTAHYSCGTPLAIGAIVAGATDQTIAVLRQFGLAVGLAFQVRDDVLNLVDAGDSSKDFRLDITDGKRTLPVVHALQTSGQREELINILSSHTSQESMLACAVRILEESGSIEFATNYAFQKVAAAKSDLEAILPTSRERDLILSSADYFISRNR